MFELRVFLLIPLFICFWPAAYSGRTKDSCICGYGGLCRFISGKPVNWNCSYDSCETISGGLYANCSILVNHCRSSPCLNHGKCVMSFGSFFCECPSGFFGHTCNYRRNEETLDMDAVVAPRAWFQVNRATLRTNQPMYMTFEEPGEEVQLQVRFKDGRFFEQTVANFRILNAKRQCIRDAMANHKERDIRICETLPDKNVYSALINTRFFEDGNEEIKVQLPSSGVVEGRVDLIHIAIMNRRRVSFSQEYRIHTSFELSELCKFKVSFTGCSRNKYMNVLYSKSRPIFLRALLAPTFENCSRGLTVSVKWNMPAYGAQHSFLRRRGAFGVSINGEFLDVGLHFIDFAYIMKGTPPHYGSSRPTYSFGRCWFKQVPGPFNVGIQNGGNQTVPCRSPLVLRLVSHNSNFPVNELASKWICRNKEAEEDGACRKQRFLGSKIIFGTLSCYHSVIFDVVVLHLRTGLKLYTEIEVESTEHIDTLQCHCLHNCRPNVNPLSKTLLLADDFRLSTDIRNSPINWYAWIRLSRIAWEIGRFIVPGSSNRFVEIDRGALVFPHLESFKETVLVVRAQEGRRYCEILLKIQSTHIPLQTKLYPNSYNKFVQEYRNRIAVVNANTNLMNQQHTFEARERISLRKRGDYVVETVRIIRAGYNVLRNLRLSHPTYIVAKNPRGLESEVTQIHEPTNKDRRFSIREIEDMISRMEIIHAGGDVELVLSELVYISRFLMVLPNPPLRLRTRLLHILNEMTLDTFCGIPSLYDMFVTIIARLTATSDATKPPFNLDSFPWVAPSDDVGPEELLQMDEFRKLSIETVLKLAKDYVGVISKNYPTNPSAVIAFVFQALLNYSLLRLREPQWEKHYASQHLNKMQNAELYEKFCNCVDYLLKAGDYHSEGYSDHKSYNAGTSTFFYTIFSRIAVSRIASEIFNSIQRIAIRITIEDDSVPDFTTLYLGVYVEIPSQTEMTSRVHIAFFTHLAREPVKAKIEVQMKVQQPMDEDSDFTILDSVRDLSDRTPEKSMTMYRIEFSPVSDVVTDRDDRKIILHFISQADIRFHIDRDVPKYETVSLSPDHGSGNFNVSLISDRNTFYLALIPGANVSAGTSHHVRIDASEFVCVRRPSPSMSGSLNNGKEICEIGGTNQTNTTGNSEVVCICSGPGIIYTYKLAALVFKVLTEENVEYEFEGLDDSAFSLFIFSLVLPFVLALFVIAWWRDERNKTRNIERFIMHNRTARCRHRKTVVHLDMSMEFIQIFSDSYPGETHPYIVGVYTGTHLFAGTASKVALQVHGNESSSRVHILRTSSYQALMLGQDDWFLLYTKERLGKILGISLWQDFVSSCPNWYCSHVVVYDITGALWYSFPVYRWFRIDEGVQFCRTAFFHAAKFHPENHGLLTFTFCKHYKTVLRNVNTLISVFSKHRRYIFSYRQKALLVAMFLLSLLSSVVLLEGPWQPASLETDEHLLWKAFIALLPIFILLAALTSVFMRSYEYTRKTKKLDLRKVNELKSMMTEKKDDVHITFKPVNLDSKLLVDAEPSAGSSKKKSSTIPARSHESPLSHGYGEKRNVGESRHNSPERWNQGSLWIQKTTAQSWIPDASFRPIRFDHELNYIRYGGRMYLFVGWIIATLVIIMALVYLSYRTFSSPYPGRNVLLVTIIAVLLEMLVVEPMILLATSCYTVFKTRQGNFECNILELAGLPENENKIDHVRFLEALIQPYYKPQRTKRLERLYQHYKGCHAFKILLYFLLLSIFALIPLVWLAAEQDIYSIWLKGNRTREMIQDYIQIKYLWEPSSSQKTKDYRNREILLLLTGYIRLTSLVKWYNGKPIAVAFWRIWHGNALNFLHIGWKHGSHPFKITQIGKQHSPWFIDRNSKLYGTTVFRYLKATNNSKILTCVSSDGKHSLIRRGRLTVFIFFLQIETKNLVDELFKPYYSSAYGLFDPYINNSAFVSEWHPIRTSESTPWKDLLMYNGIYGKTGLFYPQSCGIQVFVRGEKKLKSLGIQTAVYENLDTRTRALIVDMNLVQPLFSPRVIAPKYGLTVIHILFESIGGGPHTMTIRSATIHAPSAKTTVGYLSVVYYSILTLASWSFIVKTWQEGLTVFRQFRNCVLVVIAILSFALDALFLKDYVIDHVTDNTAKRIDVNTHVDFVHYMVTSSNLEKVLNGPLYLCLCLVMTDLIYEINRLKGRHDARLIRICPIAVVLYLFGSICFQEAMKVLDVVPVPSMSMIRTISYIGDSDGAKAIIYLFKFIWLAAAGIVIAFFSEGLERETAGFPCFKILSSGHYLPSSFVCGKSRDASNSDSSSLRSTNESVSERRSSRGSARRPSKMPPREEKQATDGGSPHMYSSVTNRLLRIYQLIE